IVKGTGHGGIADVNGMIELIGIPSGTHTIEFSFVGYKSQSSSYVFPLATSDTFDIFSKSCDRGDGGSNNIDYQEYTNYSRNSDSFGTYWR
ncbi:MAG: carboxypeptidase-like regulatory domain-containing protein, partial [Bacteroidales bacterium]